MGANGSVHKKLDKEEAKKLSSETHLDLKELAKIYDWYQDLEANDTDAIGDSISKDMFIKEVLKLDDANKDIGAFLFDNIIDHDHSGTVSFKELASFSALLSKEPEERKVMMLFDAFDLDRSGLLDHDEVKNLLKRSLQLAVALGTPIDGKRPAIHDISEDEIRSLFGAVDEDHDGFISLDEFQVACNENPLLKQVLEFFEEFSPDVRQAVSMADKAADEFRSQTGGEAAARPKTPPRGASLTPHEAGPAPSPAGAPLTQPAPPPRGASLGGATPKPAADRKQQERCRFEGPVTVTVEFLSHLSAEVQPLHLAVVMSYNGKELLHTKPQKKSSGVFFREPASLDVRGNVPLVLNVMRCETGMLGKVKSEEVLATVNVLPTVILLKAPLTRLSIPVRAPGGDHLLCQMAIGIKPDWSAGTTTLMAPAKAPRPAPAAGAPAGVEGGVFSTTSHAATEAGDPPHAPPPTPAPEPAPAPEAAPAPAPAAPAPAPAAPEDPMAAMAARMAALEAENAALKAKVAASEPKAP